jgi:hypothetical protein
VFWGLAPCSLVEVYQRFRGTCCLHRRRGNLKSYLQQGLLILLILFCILWNNELFLRKIVVKAHGACADNLLTTNLR